MQDKCTYHFRSAIFSGKKKPQPLRATSQQSCSVTGIRPMRINLKSPTKASFRGLFKFIHARLIAFVQIRDCGIYLILIIDYSIIVATLPDPTVLPPSRLRGTINYVGFHYKYYIILTYNNHIFCSTYIFRSFYSQFYSHLLVNNANLFKIYVIYSLSHHFY